MKTAPRFERGACFKFAFLINARRCRQRRRR